MKYDIIVAHPYKHHAFPMAFGCISSGLHVGVAMPLYDASIAKILRFMPGPIGKRLMGYSHPGIDKTKYITGWAWQARKLASFLGELRNFQFLYDRHLAHLIRSGKLSTKVLVTLQDYMPLSVQAAKEFGSIIWRDEIIGDSPSIRKRIISAYVNLNLAPPEFPVVPDAPKPNLITAPSEYTKSALLEVHALDTPIHCVPYGVNTNRFHPALRRRSSPDSIRIATRANNIRKGGHILYKAIENNADLFSKSAGCKIEFISIGRISPPLRSIVCWQKISPDVRISEIDIPNADMPDFLRTCDAFLMPTLNESMSLMMAEAMASGLPIIATHYAGVDFFIDGHNGKICDIESVDAFSTSLSSFLLARDSWQQWGLAARESACLHDWSSYERDISEIALLAANN